MWDICAVVSALQREYGELDGVHRQRGGMWWRARKELSCRLWVSGLWDSSLSGWWERGAREDATRATATQGRAGA